MCLHRALIAEQSIEHGKYSHISNIKYSELNVTFHSSDDITIITLVLLGPCIYQTKLDTRTVSQSAVTSSPTP